MGGDSISKRIHPWSIDVWSMGAIFLEILIGFPLWMSYKGRIIKEGIYDQTSTCMTGLFGIQGRLPKKIIQKQTHTINNLKHILKKQFNGDHCLGPNLNLNESFLDLLVRMLDLNPKNRISPKDLAEHQFLKS